MNRAVKLLPWLAGVALVVGSLFGVTKLIQAEGEPQPSAKPAATATAGSVTVLGTVASDPNTSPVGPPAVAAIVSVTQVFVHDGQEVKPGDKLVQFDDSVVAPNLAVAEAAIAGANVLVEKAHAAVEIHQKKIDVQKIAIETARREIDRSETSLELGKRNALKLLQTNPYNGQPYTEDQRQQLLNDNQELRQAASTLAVAKSKLAGEEKTLEGLMLVPIGADVRAAESQVATARAKLAEAQAGVAAHTVTAKMQGTVEQVFAAPGMSYGPGTRVPLLYLVPSGKRIVRAEVEAEFVSKVADKTGKPVTVVDANNFELKYAGTVRRVGTAFFPKRSQADGMALTVVKVVEVIIDLGDPPSGTPPLLVGQPVRVTFQ